MPVMCSTATRRYIKTGVVQVANLAVHAGKTVTTNLLRGELATHFFACTLGDIFPLINIHILLGLARAGM